jgi:tRNA threonylcarbamoyladenosine biosynthesis protein TsaE
MPSIALPDPAATRRLGAALADLARPGDVLALYGDLGMGKTELARGFVQRLAGATTEVPSPTFNLVLTYDTATATLWHFDLYRIEREEELAELGLEDAFADGISLIEWPERLGRHLPVDHLTVTLTAAGEGRAANVSGGGDWPARLQGLAA